MRNSIFGSNNELLAFIGDRFEGFKRKFAYSCSVFGNERNIRLKDAGKRETVARKEVVAIICTIRPLPSLCLRVSFK